MPNTGEDISSLIHLNHFTLIALRIFLLQELAHSLRRFKQSATQSTSEKKLCNQQTITCETADSFIWIWDMTQESTTSPCHLTRVLQDKPNLSRRIFFYRCFFFFTNAQVAALLGPGFSCAVPQKRKCARAVQSGFVTPRK